VGTALVGQTVLYRCWWMAGSEVPWLLAARLSRSRVAWSLYVVRFGHASALGSAVVPSLLRWRAAADSRKPEPSLSLAGALEACLIVRLGFKPRGTSHWQWSQQQSDVMVPITSGGQFGPPASGRTRMIIGSRAQTDHPSQSLPRSLPQYQAATVTVRKNQSLKFDASI
jgi:hypothetical protein